MENPEPRAQYLNVVLRQIERTSLRIPRFQRHFVWGESDVLELLGSIKMGYPIGSILTWRVEAGDDYFSGFRRGPFPEADQDLHSFEVILDGAQRLSSLYGCLKSPGDDSVYRVFYDLKAEQFVHQSSLRELEPWHVPMSALFDSRAFLHTQGEIAALNDGEELLPRALDLFSTFQDYQIPIIALSNAVLEDVVEVFRRVNSSGTPLSSVDFVRALTWQSSFDLEETFASFAERYQGTSLEGLSEEFLIRCLAIASGLSLDTREVVQLKELSNRPGGLVTEVANMADALDRMAQFLQRLEITAISEVPYEVQRLILFGAMYFDVDVDPAVLESWLWRSTFAEEHQSKPESYTTRLIRDLRQGNVAEALDVRKPLELDLFAYRARRAGSAVTTGFDLLLRRNQARSLLSGEALAPSTGMHGLLFSRVQLEQSLGTPVPNVGLLANLVLLSPNDAARWRQSRPTMDIAALFDLCEEETGAASEIWTSQGVSRDVPRDPIAALEERSRVLMGEVL